MLLFASTNTFLVAIAIVGASVPMLALSTPVAATEYVTWSVPPSVAHSPTPTPKAMSARDLTTAANSGSPPAYLIVILIFAPALFCLGICHELNPSRDRQGPQLYIPSLPERADMAARRQRHDIWSTQLYMPTLPERAEMAARRAARQAARQAARRNGGVIQPRTDPVPSYAEVNATSSSPGPPRVEYNAIESPALPPPAYEPRRKATHPSPHRSGYHSLRSAPNSHLRAFQEATRGNHTDSQHV